MRVNKFIALILFEILLITQIKSETVNKKMIVDTNTNEQQRISILVGKAGEDDPENPPDSGNENETPSGGEQVVESTSSDFCSSGSGTKCCFQFTWQGYIEESLIPAPENTTCEYLMKEKKDDSMACFDPIVYTSKVGSQNAGNAPNISELYKLAEENNWNIFCPLTQDKACLTYKFYSRGGKKQLVNETRFCGSVTEILSGKRLNSGCYSQKVSGYERQVCSCQGHLCNSSHQLKFTLIGSFVWILLFLFNLK